MGFGDKGYVVRSWLRARWGEDVYRFTEEFSAGFSGCSRRERGSARDFKPGGSPKHILNLKKQ
jgi:hypothetical protein